MRAFGNVGLVLVVSVVCGKSVFVLVVVVVCGNVGAIPVVRRQFRCQGLVIVVYLAARGVAAFVMVVLCAGVVVLVALVVFGVVIDVVGKVFVIVLLLFVVLLVWFLLCLLVCLFLLHA